MVWYSSALYINIKWIFLLFPAGSCSCGTVPFTIILSTISKSIVLIPSPAAPLHSLEQYWCQVREWRVRLSSLRGCDDHSVNGAFVTLILLSARSRSFVITLKCYSLSARRSFYFLLKASSFICCTSLHIRWLSSG